MKIKDFQDAGKLRFPSRANPHRATPNIIFDDSLGGRDGDFF